MSFRLADEEAFEASSCGYSSGGDSGEERDRFPDSAGGHRRQSAPPQAPLMRMNSDSIYDMSGMTAHLPAKKGLSAYYQGKSQSFACMSEVRSLEDLQKKEKPPRRIKPCKSYAALGGMPAKQVPAASSCANLGLMAAGNGFGRAPRNIPINQDCYHQ